MGRLKIMSPEGREGFWQMLTLADKGGVGGLENADNGWQRCEGCLTYDNIIEKCQNEVETNYEIALQCIVLG